MRLAPQLNDQLLALADQAEAQQGPLAALHRASLAQLRQRLLPEKFAETWKYTKLQPLAQGHLQQYTPAAEAPSELPRFDIEPLVIVNGRLPERLPHWQGVTLERLQPQDVTQLADTTFSFFNGASLNEGLRLSVADNATPSDLFHVVFVSSGDAPSHHHTRLQVELGRNSRLQLVEQYLGNGPVLCNAVTHINAADNSELTHCRLQSESADNLHIGQLAIRQARTSRVQSFQFSQGSQLKRNDVQVRLEGEGAELTMGGAFVACGNSHVDNQISLDHAVPHCTSEQTYRGIAGDKGHAIFNGRIHILPGAVKTQADLSNKNLLLSQGAEIDSKPELEIYNDDVKCSHGTTIGKLDPTMRFYLQSRGIDAVSAQRMLSIGFIQEQINQLPNEALADWVRQWLEGAITEAL